MAGPQKGKGGKGNPSTPNSAKSKKSISKDKKVDQNNEEQSSESKAKPIKCKECEEVCLAVDFHKDIDDDSIDCNLCGFWYHKPCTNISTEEWELLKKGNENITFKCDTCLQNTTLQDEKQTDFFSNLLLKNNDRLLTHIESIEAKILQKVDEKIEQRMLEFDNKNQTHNATVLSKIDSLESGILQKVDQKIEESLRRFDEKNEQKMNEKLNEKINAETHSKKEQLEIEDKIQKQISQSFDELKDREERKTNIIIFNVKESSNANKEEAANEDLENIKKVLTHTNPDLSETVLKNLTKDKLSRFGKEPTTSNENESSKPRPIKVTLPDEKTKFKVLKNSNLLKTYQPQNIGLKPRAVFAVE